jgi:hypothetical protein
MICLHDELLWLLCLGATLALPYLGFFHNPGLIERAIRSLHILRTSRPLSDIREVRKASPLYLFGSPVNPSKQAGRQEADADSQGTGPMLCPSNRPLS